MPEPAANNRPLEERVQEVIEAIRPYIQGDGGDLQLVGIEDNVVKVRLRGACVGCPHSLMTLKMGVERHMRERVPEIKSVEAVK